MVITEHTTKDQQAIAHNDDSDMHNDEIGENTGEDTGLAKADKTNKQDKKDDERVTTVTPGNDNGDPGPPVKDSSNKDEGPAKENL
ncbi:MAG TPA: hypothetical protein VGC01_09355 [Mucilaginibacter sp.]